MKKSLKFAIVSILVVLAVFLIISCDGGAVENSPAVQNATKAFQIGSSNESYDTLKLAVQALKDKSKSGTKAASEPYTIRLNWDKTDAGATISGIDAEVKIDFQGHTLTLSDGSEGIVIANTGKVVEITNGTVQVAVGASLKFGTTAVITASTDTTLSASINASNTAADAIETTGGNFNIQGSAQITSREDKRTIVATETSVVKVDSSQVILTGGMKLAGNADVNLGDATLKLTQDIEKGDECTLEVKAEKVEPQNDSVHQDKIDEARHNHTFSSDWETDDDHHWHAATCEHSQLKSSYENHIWREGIVTTDPGCTTVGNRTYYCKCGESYLEEISSLGHNFISEITEPTATSEGFTTHRCSRCDYYYIDSIVPAIGYSFGSPNWNWYDNNTRVEAVFTSTNVPSYSVTVEGTVTVENSVLATCTQNGHASSIASVTFQETEYTSKKTVNYSALGHSLEIISAKAPTCTEVGWNAYERCSRCDYTTYVEITALGHSIIHHEAQAPTYTEAGWNAHDTCSRCDYTTYVEIPALAHSIIHHEAKAATCTEIGWNAYDTCSECDYTTYVEIPALGHSLVHHEAKAATCTEIGWNAYDTCSRCSYTTYEEIHVNTEAHKYSDNWTSDDNNHWHASVCGHDVVSEKDEHHYDGSNMCTICGYVDYSNLFSVSSGLINLIDKENVPSIIIIPSTINGILVTGIGDEAFLNCSTIVEVIIPDSVTSIGIRSFYGCTGLKSITIPDSVSTIKSGVFSGCTGLTSITISNSVTRIGTNAFYGCTGLTNITIPDSVTSIGEYAFYGCTGLTSIIISNSITGIGEHAFNGCTSLTNIAIGDSVKSIGYCAFYDCVGLKRIEIPASIEILGHSSSYGVFSGYSGEVLFADGIRQIPPYALYKAVGVTSVTIPDSVTSIGDYAFSGCTGLKKITIPDSVTSIGKYAFYGCTGLTSLTIPNSVTSIEVKAFEGCNNIEDLTIPFIGNNDDYGFIGYIFGATNYSENYKFVPLRLKNIRITSTESIGDYAFDACTGLTSITIGDSVEKIGDYAFRGCTGLTSVAIPDSVTEVGSYAFDACTGLTSITIGDSVEKIGDYAFRGCTGLTSVAIPDSVTEVCSYAFDACTGLTSITIGDSVKHIGNEAFRGCTGLTSITIGDSVESIGNYAFKDCEELTSVIIGDSVKSIGAYAFKGCTKLTSVIIGDSVKSIGEEAFSGCTDLTSITLPDSVTSIGGFAFYRCMGLTSITIPNSLTMICDGAFCNTGLTSITVPDSVTSIGEKAFCGCYCSTSITIGNSVKQIGQGAFSGCEGLTNIIIPNSVTSIGDYAFSGCTGLKKITIPNSVTSIGYGAFKNCIAITSITIPTSVKSIGYGVFEKCNNLKDLTIPFIGFDHDNDEILGYFFSGFKWNGSYSVPSADNKYVPSALKNVSITSATRIGARAFEQCSNLTSIIIGDSVNIIGDSAFYGCTGLTSITIGKHVRTIGYFAFGGCTGITNIIIPNSVTSIGDYAFGGCTGITNIIIPNSVTSIGVGAFSGCTGFTSITIPASIRTMRYSDNSYYDTHYGVFSGYSGEVVFANGCTKIPSYALYYASGVTSVTIPDSVTSIGDYAFGGCTGLTSIPLPDSVTSIGLFAFSGCTVSSITVPVSVKTMRYYNSPYSDYHYGVFSDYSGEVVFADGCTNIPSYALYEARDVTSVVIPDSVTSIGNYSFYYTRLDEVLYKGTKSQWDYIEKENYCNGQVYAILNCQDGTYDL